MKRIFAAVAIFVFLLSSSFPQNVRAEANESESTLLNANAFFAEKDYLPTEENGQTVFISLNGDSAKCTGKGVIIENQTITITKSGIYSISGKLSNGEIVIDADKQDVIHLILNGVQIHTESICALYGEQAQKVIVTLADHTENLLTNSGKQESFDDSKVDAVFYAKKNLTLNGNGKLMVEAETGHAIVCKENLVISGGEYEITSEKSGISGKDSLAISQGKFHIHSGSDGIRAKNEEDTSLGNLYILDGEFIIDAGQDGIQATGALQIENGQFRIISGGGSEAGTMKASDAAGGWGRGPWDAQAANSDSVSAKGIKSGRQLFLLGGSYSLDCADDGIHAGGDIRISSGNFQILTADDGIHSDAALWIQDGTFLLPYCYEGLEGQSVTIDNGSFEITANDDGINASGGVDQSGGWGRSFMADSNAFIEINGGTITIVSDGDCLDSNGTLTLNGGTLTLTCNGYGNTAIDYETEFQNNGAAVTTNDGSENGVGQMHGMGGKQYNGFGGRDFGGRNQFTNGNIPEPPEDRDHNGQGWDRQGNPFPGDGFPNANQDGFPFPQ